MDALRKAMEEAAINLQQKIAEELEKNSEKSNQKSKKQASYFQRYITRIKDNLQVQVRNIHVRLEERREHGVQKASHACLGLILQELNLRTVARNNVHFDVTEDDDSSDNEKVAKDHTELK